MSLCYKCNTAIKKNDEKAPIIKCKGCTRLICGKCSELSATELRVFSLQNPKLSYLCKDCEDGLKQIPALRKLVTELQQQLIELKENQKHNIGIDHIINEIAEREKRARNIIVFGIEESLSDNHDDRKAHDKREFLQAIKDVPVNETEVVAAVRLGKPIGNKPRPIKVILRTKDSALTTLKNKKSLPKSVNVKSDMTPFQRDQLKKLQEQLLERTNNGEKDLTIKYIHNQPKIIKATKN